MWHAGTHPDPHELEQRVNSLLRARHKATPFSSSGTLVRAVLQTGIVRMALVAAAAVNAFCTASVRAGEPTAAASFSPSQKSHWAFQPIIRPRAPEVHDVHSVRSTVDAFILSRLEPEGMSFAPPADRRDFIRRATYDLLGLPPTPEEVSAFLADDRPDTCDRLIDGLLANPHYGEAEARMWLDLVRFAETAGFNADPPRPLAYKYRDYVINAFNADLPYDRFIIEQIAGDELFPDRVDALAATGFNRMWPDESNASNILKSRQESLNDLTANVGVVFLGLSLGWRSVTIISSTPFPRRISTGCRRFSPALSSRTALPWEPTRNWKHIKHSSHAGTPKRRRPAKNSAGWSTRPV